MITKPTGTERRKVMDLARRYKAKGFSVWSAHGAYEKPAEFGGVAPDLVAQSPEGKIILVEVKARESLKKSSKDLEQLATYAQKTPGVQFDLVVTGPQRAKSRRE